MPKMNGLEMSQRLKGVRPDMAVMFISGYDDSVVSQSVLMQPATELLTKPINTMTLAQTVRRMLDKANLIRKQD
jgi:FixJ family two-component response regulator